MIHLLIFLFSMIIGLAPMDWFTDCAMRAITQHIFDLYWDTTTHQLTLRTEFMNADGYLINPTWLLKHLLTVSSSYPTIAQIFWSREAVLLSCFREIEKKYSTVFSWIELNMWCPARNVMQTGWWSALLKEREKSLAIIKTLAEWHMLPFSIKTRIGLTHEDRDDQMKFLVEASKYCSMISVHWRTVAQWYWWDIDWDFISTLKKKIAPSCKLIWNWWITSYETLLEKQGILDGIMVGQGAIGNPRIFTPHVPTRTEIKETILLHLDYMMASEYFYQQQKKDFTGILSMPNIQDLSYQHQEFSTAGMVIAEFRKHLFQYVKWIPWSKEFKVKVSTITDYAELVTAIEAFFA